MATKSEYVTMDGYIYNIYKIKLKLRPLTHLHKNLGNRRFFNICI